MKARALFVVALLFPSIGLASSILECSTRAEAYTGRFVLDETGAFSLSGQKGTQKFECELSLSDYSYKPEAEVANLTLRMKVRKCATDSGTPYRDRALARRMSLVVTKAKLNDSQADVFWVGYLQPSQCKISKYEKESIARNAEKFRQGLLR